MTPQGIAQLKRHEGFRSKPYQCPAGKWTIGYGHNLENNGIPVETYMKFDWSKETAHTILINDITEVESYLEYIFPEWDLIAPIRQDALINLMFNVGVGTFRTFKTVIKGVKENNWEYVAQRLEKYAWYKQVGSRSAEIVSMIRGE